MRKQQGANADRVLEAYPRTSAPGVALAAVGTDFGFACKPVPVVADLTKWVPTFAYEFRDETSPPRPYMNVPPSFSICAGPTSDVPYVWQSETTVPLTQTQKGADHGALSAHSAAWRFRPALARLCLVLSESRRILRRADQEPAHAPRLCARGDRILRLACGEGCHAAHGDRVAARAIRAHGQERRFREDTAMTPECGRRAGAENHPLLFALAAALVLPTAAALARGRCGRPRQTGSCALNSFRPGPIVKQHPELTPWRHEELVA